MLMNQAVVFTKPLHHLGIGLTPEDLDASTRAYFEAKGFDFVLAKKVTGSELAARDVIRQHYLMYSQAALAEHLELSDSGREKFKAAFGKSWDDEVGAGRILPLNDLLERKGIDVHQLFDVWNGLFGAGKTAKIQDGMIMAYSEDLDAYLVNAFYPAMQANFYHPDTVMYYYVLEFDPSKTSWLDFRKTVLGATNSAKADPASFRGKLYAEYPVEFPGRDNFVHGSAGPFEGFVERAIHESGFYMESNPVGRYLAKRGLTLESFAAWKNAQSINAIGALFDETEERDTDEVLSILDNTSFKL